MERNELRAHCLGKTAAVEDFPFGEDVAVYKVLDKIFALLPVAGPVRISLKCDPALAVVLRDTHPAVKPGWHLNKRHWNTVEVDGSIPNDEILDMVDHSYAQVVKGLTQRQREMLQGLNR